MSFHANSKLVALDVHLNVYIYIHIMCIYILCKYIYIYIYINWNHRSRPHRNLFCAFNSPEKSEKNQLGSSSQFGELWLFSKHVWNTHTRFIGWYTSIIHRYTMCFSQNEVFHPGHVYTCSPCIVFIHMYIYIGIYKYPIAIHPHVLFVNSC